MNKLDKASKIMLAVNAVINLSGYITFLQTDYQLVRPIVPQSVIFLIAKTAEITGLITSILFLIALGFYFFEKRLITIIICSLAILIHFVFNQYLVFNF
jgi:hypothetical protein